MIAIFIHMEALPSKRKELVQTVESLIAETQIKRGCLSAYCYQRVADENTFLLVEQWSDQKDFETHLGSEIFAVLIGAGSLMLNKPEIVIHVIEQSKVLNL